MRRASLVRRHSRLLLFHPFPLDVQAGPAHKPTLHLQRGPHNTSILASPRVTHPLHGTLASFPGKERDGDSLSQFKEFLPGEDASDARRSLLVGAGEWYMLCDNGLWCLRVLASLLCLFLSELTSIR